MNSRMQRSWDIPRKSKIIRYEPDRIPGTTKIRTYTANGSLYSKESTLEKMLERAKLCRDAEAEK